MPVGLPCRCLCCRLNRKIKDLGYLPWNTQVMKMVWFGRCAIPCIVLAALVFAFWVWTVGRVGTCLVLKYIDDETAKWRSDWSVWCVSLVPLLRCWYFFCYVSITIAVSSISLKVDTHLRKLPDTPVARFYFLRCMRPVYFVKGDLGLQSNHSAWVW